MKRLACLIILLPFLVCSQSSKKYSSLLWKISGNGLKKPSYLYGTMHVSNRVAYYLSEQFFDALKSVDVVGLETNPGEWLENMEKTGELSELSQFRGTDYYSKDFYKATFASSFPDKRILQGMLSYDPDIIDGLLYRQNKTKENFEESTYIDLFIFQTASKLNKQVISLENFAQSEIKARLSALPDEQNGEEIATSRDYYSSTQKIEDAYRDGNLDLLDSLSKLASTRNTQRYLIDDRNVYFVSTIDSVLKTKTLFSGVGAAHLPGENGVIELLRKKGYTVEPVTPTVSKKSNALREELDVQVKPVFFQKQTVSDSIFSVSLPGKLSPIISLENIKYYIHADMVNGNFYTIARLRYLGPLFNVSAQQMMQKMDSLLFEYIPGKIVIKKEITTANGIKGFEVVNKTRRGDEQHYQVYFTDLEMVLFKLGGKRDYATGSEAKQFFNSIQFNLKPETTVEFAPKTKGFSVRLPGNYSYIKNDGSSLIGLVEDLGAYSKTKKQFYGVKQAVYSDFNYLEEDTFELNRFSKNILASYNFTLQTTSEIKKEQGFPCVLFTGKNSTGNFFYGKVYIKGIHYYLVYLVSDKESSFENELFTSFKITDFAYINPIKEITDKDFYFKAKDEVTDNSLSRFNEAYAKAYEATKTRKDTVKNDFDYRSGNKFYYSPSSNEYVNINFEKYNDYDYRDPKKVEERIAESFKNNTSLIVARKTVLENNGVKQYNYILKDTATARAIDFRLFFKNGLMQEISTQYDTTLGLRGWAKEFMETFRPLDTVIGKPIFENKFAKFLDDLSGSDTTLRRIANTSLQGSLGMQKAYGDDYVKFLSGPKIAQVNEDSRAQLFVNGGTIENEKIIEPYKKLYKQYTDSFYLQLCLIKGLGYLKTQSSYNALYDLLMNETPLVGSESTVNDVFATLHDSLELCKKFFPSMLVLSRYDEYRDAVYSLMADLVNKKLISPQSYASQKEAILVDANLALKRYSPAKSSASQADYSSFDHLDRSSRELAEQIKMNLDGLAENNLYKGTSFLRNVDSYNRQPLVNYAYILSPFYKTDEKTKAFFGKLAKIRAQNIAMPVAIDLLKHGIQINDTLVPFYSRNKYTRAYFYSELEKEKLADKFDKNYLSQESLIESVLLSQRQLNNFYNYERDKFKKDSIAPVKTLTAKNKYQRGKLYIYRSVKSRNEDEQWSAVFINDTKEAVTAKIEIVNAGYVIDKNKTEEENINELLDYFSMAYRKRAVVASADR